jgi:flagellar protein FlbD
MITVTRLNGKQVVVNAELIRFVEQTPDTLITLTSGDKLLVKENMEEVVRRAIEYARSIRTNFNM